MFQKIYKKGLKKTVSSHFCSFLVVSKLVWKKLESHHIFSRCSILSIFPSEKDLRMDYLVFSPNNLLENAKKFKNVKGQLFLHAFKLV